MDVSPGFLLPGIRAQGLLVADGTKQGRIAANVNDITSRDFLCVRRGLSRDAS
jgi:hypothetical protein